MKFPRPSNPSGKNRRQQRYAARRRDASLSLGRSRRVLHEQLEDRWLLSVNLLGSFAGMTIDSNTGGGTQTPPDPCGAASDATYVETVKQQVSLYTKATGAMVATDNLDDFFITTGGLAHADATSSLLDPEMTYDDQIGRFIVSEMDYDFGPGHVSAFDFAVSKSSDPASLTTADWNFYQVNTSENDGTTSGTFDADFVGNVGWNHDAFVFTLNMFAVDGSTAHVQVNSVSNSDLLNGVSQANLHYYRNDNYDSLSLRPAVMHDSKAGDPMWFVDQVDGKTHIQVFRMTNVLSNSATFTGTQLLVNPYTDIHQSGVYPKQPNGTTVTTNQDSRIQNVAEDNDILVASQAVNVSPTENDARWYEIDVSGGTPVLRDQGSVSGGNNTYLYCPAVDINAAGDIGMTYIRSGTDTTSDYMSMWVTGRTPTDSAGTMQTPQLVKAGAANYSDSNPNGSQAGIFSGISTDSDGSFFAVSEYATNRTSGNWGTEVAHFSVSGSSSGPPSVVYVNTAWSGFASGQSITDADPVTTGNQSAIFGSTAFATVGAALAAVAPGGTVYVSSGSYATEAVDLTQDDTLALLGTAPATPGTVSFGSLTTAAGTTVDTGSVGGLDNTLQEGSLGTSTTAAGVISGSGSLIVQGGALTLSDSGNSYAGGTIVSGGTLLVDGAAGSGSVTVDNGATVGGTGTVAGALIVSAGGTVSPGDPTSSTSKLATGPLTLLGTYAAQINGAATAGTDYDQLDVTGASTLTGGSLTVTLGYAPSAGDTITLLSGTGTVTGPVSVNGVPVTEEGQLSLSHNGVSYEFTLSYAGDKLTLALNANPIINVDSLVSGTSHTVNVSASAGNTIVTVDGKTVLDDPTALLSSLTLNGQTANDTFDVGAIGVPLTINGGTGTDTFNVTGPLAAASTIAGGSSADTLNFNAGGQAVTVSASTVTQSGAAMLNYSGIGSLKITNDGGVTLQGTSNATNTVTIERDPSDNNSNDVTLNGGSAIVISSTSSLDVAGGGGTATNQVTVVEDANGLPQFSSAAAGAHTNATFTGSNPNPGNVGLNISGAGSGTNSLIFDFTNSHTVTNYSDSVAAANSGIVAISGALNVSFSGLATLAYDGSGGTLAVNDAANSSVTDLTVSDPSPSGGQTAVNGNGSWAAVTFSGFDSLLVQGDNAKDNTVTLAAADSAATNGHALANVTLQGGSGNDTINVDSLPGSIAATLLGGDGSNRFNLDETGGTHDLASIAGTVNVSPAGDSTTASDTLSIDGSAHLGGRTVVVTSTTIKGITGSGASTIDYDGSGRIRNVVISGGGSGNEFDIQGTNSSVSGGYTINSGSDADTVNVSSDAPTNAGTLANIQAPIFLNTQGGGDSLNVSDLGAASAATYSLAGGSTAGSTTLSTTDSASITYDANGTSGQLAHFSLTGSAAGANTYNIGVTSAMLSTTITDGSAAGTGGSTFNIQADQLLAGSANTFNGNGNGNQFNLSYAADASTSSAAGTSLVVNAGTTGSSASPNVVNIKATVDTHARTLGVTYTSAPSGPIDVTGLGTDSAGPGLQIAAAQQVSFFGGSANSDTATVTAPASGSLFVTSTGSNSATVSTGSNGSEPVVSFSGIQTLDLKGSGVGNTLNFTGDGKAGVTVDLGAQTITETGFQPVSFTGVATVNLDAAGAAVKVVGSANDDTLTVTPTGVASATAQQSTGPVLNLSGAASLLVDLLSGNNTLAVDASASNDQITAQTNASGNPSVTVVQGGSADLPVAYVAADLSALDINGQAGNDTLTVDSSNGAVTTPITFDGGSGNGVVSFVDTVHANVSDVAAPGPSSGQGTETLNFGTTASPLSEAVQFSGVNTVYDSVPGLVTVLGTPGNDTISYGQGDDTTGKPNAAWGRVAVNNLSPFNFTDKVALAIDTGLSSDTVNVQAANAPTGLAGITIGGSGVGSSDVLNFTGDGAQTATVNLATSTITETGFPPVSLSRIGTVSVNAAGAAVKVVGSANDDTLSVTPTGASSATAQESTGPVFNFSGVASLLVDLLGGANTLVVDASANSNQVTAQTNSSGNPSVTVAQGGSADLPIGYVAADLSALDINAAGAAVNLVGSANDDTLTVTPTGTGSATAQENGTGPVFNFTGAASLLVDLLGGTNTLAVDASANNDQITAQTNPPDNPTVTVAQGPSTDLPISYVAADLAALDINSQGGGTLTVDSSDGAITTPITLDGESGNATVSFVDTVHTNVSAVDAPGSSSGQGSETLNFGTTASPVLETVHFSGVNSIYDSVPGPLTVLGTSGNDAVNYAEGDDTTGAPNAAWGQVTVDNGSVFNFTGKTSLTIDTGAGSDTVDLADSATPASLASINVTGSGTTGNVTLTAHSIPGAANVLVVTPTGTGSGTLMNVDQSQPIVTFVGLSQLDVAARTADAGQELIETGTSGDDTFELTPGATGESGTILGLEAGAAGFTFVPVAFSGFNAGSAGASSIVLGSAFGHGATGGSDTATIDGTAGDDTFAIQPSSVFTNANGVIETVGGVQHVEVVVDPMAGVSKVILRSVGGTDVANVTMPTLQPTISYSVEGNAAGTTTLDLTSPAKAATTVDLAAGTIGVTGGNPLSFTGLTALNVNAHGGALTIVDANAHTDLEVTPTDAESGTAQVLGTGPGSVAAPLVTFTATPILNVDLPQGDQVNVLNSTSGATLVADEPTRTVYVITAGGMQLVPVALLPDVSSVVLDGGSGATFVVVPAPGLLPAGKTDMVGQPNFQLPDNLLVDVVAGGPAAQNSLLVADYDPTSGKSSALDKSVFTVDDRTSATDGTVHVFHNNGTAPNGSNQYPDIEYADIGTVNVNSATLAGGLSTQTVANWLSDLYAQILGREPAPTELVYWINQVAGGVSSQDVAQGFVTSNEHRADQIGQLYQEYLGRPADAGGLTYWTGIWNAHGGPEMVQAGIIGSPEFYATAGKLYPSLSADAAWVTALYHDILGRAPDQQGLAFWVSYIQSNSRQSVVLGFVTSDEYRLGLINGLFQTYLGRPIDPSSGQALLKAMQLGITQDQVLTAIVSGDEYIHKAT